MDHVDAAQAFLFKKRLKVFGKAAGADPVFLDEFLRVVGEQQLREEFFCQDLLHDVPLRWLILGQLVRWPIRLWRVAHECFFLRSGLGYQACFGALGMLRRAWRYIAEAI